MTISGLVIHLKKDEPQRSAAVGAIESDERLTVGAQQGDRLAVVVESPSTAEDQVIWSWLHSLPGIEMVEVAFIGWDEVFSETERLTPK